MKKGGRSQFLAIFFFPPREEGRKWEDREGFNTTASRRCRRWKKKKGVSSSHVLRKEGGGEREIKNATATSDIGRREEWLLCRLADMGKGTCGQERRRGE